MSSVSVTLHWTRFDNFFRCYEEVKGVPKLIYVIGETHHVYIGSVGCKGGSGGLAVRYEAQYVNRSRAIFGLDTPKDQPAFAGRFTHESTTCETVGETEEFVQWIFLNGAYRKHALFTKRPIARPNLNVNHLGTPPLFLNAV